MAHKQVGIIWRGFFCLFHNNSSYEFYVKLMLHLHVLAIIRLLKVFKKKKKCISASKEVMQL